MTNFEASTNETRVLNLHCEFVEANKTAYHPFLEANMAPGMSLLWYNLNQSNYHCSNYKLGVMSGKYSWSRLILKQ